MSRGNRAASTALWVALVAGCHRDPVQEIWQVAFVPMLNVSDCSPGLQWCCQNVNATDGQFSEAWAPNEPDTLLIEGSVDDDSFEATLQCLGGPGATGSITAAWQGDAYDGTFEFGASTGCALVYPYDPPTVTLQGVVHDATSGAAVDGASIHADLGDGAATSDVHGAFYLDTHDDGDFATTPYTLSVTAAGYAAYETSALWGQHAQGVDVRLTPL